MKRSIVALVFVMAMFVSGLAYAASITIDIPLPKIIMPAPPDLVVIPGTYVYLAPDVEIDMFFFEGYWYQMHNDKWYRSNHYGGPWKHISRHKVPPAMLRLPPDYRRVQYRERLRHEDVKKHWRRWQRERRWDMRNSAPPQQMPPGGQPTSDMKPGGTAPSTTGTQPSGTAPSTTGTKPSGTAPSTTGTQPSGTAPSTTGTKPSGGMANAPSGTKPSGTAPSTTGTKPSGGMANAPSGTKPSGGMMTNAPSGTKPSGGMMTNAPSGTRPSGGMGR